jgi:hypothetical protein
MYQWNHKWERGITAKKVSCRRLGFAYWPHDVLGWMRIPSLIAGAAGILGILKYASPLAFRLLKPLNLPSIEFSWVMLALAVAVYVLCLIYWLSPEDIAKTYRKYNKKNISVAPGRWRNL